MANENKQGRNGGPRGGQVSAQAPQAPSAPPTDAPPPSDETVTTEPAIETAPEEPVMANENKQAKAPRFRMAHGSLNHNGTLYPPLAPVHLTEDQVKALGLDSVLERVEN